jgi:regulator of PEP synthase PpsR (kinase-PPPase family)
VAAVDGKLKSTVEMLADQSGETAEAFEAKLATVATELRSAIEEAASRSQLAEVADKVAAVDGKLKITVEMFAEESAETAEALEAKLTLLAADLQALVEDTTAALRLKMEAEASRQAEVAAQLDANADGTVDKLEFTQWADAQAQRVAGLEAEVSVKLDRFQQAVEDQLGGVDTKLQASLHEGRTVITPSRALCCIGNP